MANVQLENGYIRIANELFDEIYKRDFSKRQINILMFIIRLSYGFGRKRTLSIKMNDFENYGVDSTKIKKELAHLVEANIIYWDTENNIFCLNKNYSIWCKNLVPEYNKERFSNLLKQQLAKTATCQNSNPKVAKTASLDLPKQQPVQSGDTDSVSDAVPPKDILNTMKNNIIDIYYDERILKFQSEFTKIVKKPFRISSDERKKLANILNDLISQNLNLDETSAELFENFKIIKFEKINYDPSIHWLLKDNNFFKVLDGEFKEQRTNDRTNTNNEYSEYNSAAEASGWQL